MENAAEDSKAAIQLRPAWFEGYRHAAKAYYKMGKYEKSLKYFDWALNLNGEEDSSGTRQLSSPTGN
jgi:tetratricopeptide (TPR) repeat protein